MRADDAHQSTDVAWANRLLGDVFMELGRHDVAAARVEAAVAIHRELDDQTLLADDLCFLASVALNDDPAKARQFAEQAVKAATAAEDLELMVDAHVHLALAKSELNDFAGATESIDQALNLVKGLNDEHEHIRILLVAASLNAKAGRLEIARRHADTARTLAERSADPVMHRLFPTKTP